MSSHHTPPSGGGQGFPARKPTHPGANGSQPAALTAALRLLEKGLWPIPITAPDDPGPAAGKRPIGEQWGAVRHTEASLRAAWRATPWAGVGLKLGKDGGVIDVEIDDREVGEASLATLFGGQEVPTAGWESARGSHRLFRWDDRLARYGRSILKAAQLPGLEIRIGASEPGGKQLQSVVPPSPGSDGVRRKWNGCGEIAEIPESFFVYLDPIFLPNEPDPAPRTIPIVAYQPGSASIEDRARAYLERLPEAIEGQRGHDKIYYAACVLVDGFGLSFSQAMPILRDWNQVKAIPPESEKQLEHKLNDALRNTPRGGHLRDAIRPGFRAPGIWIRNPPRNSAGPTQESPGSADAEALGIIGVSQVQNRPVDWLWKHRFARASLAVMAGDGGIGKSQILLWIAAAVSNGAPFPDGSGNAPVGGVVLVSAEDRPEDTIKPRLTAMGADESKITICKARRIVKHEDGRTMVAPQTFTDIDYWQEVFDFLPDAALLIVDPLPSYLPKGIDDSKNVEVRNALEPFLEHVIAPRNLCMIGNTHLNKSSSARTPMARISGSMAYVNLSRNVHVVVRDADDPMRRYFQQIKCNNAPNDLPAMAFRIEERVIQDARCGAIETAVPVFEDQPVRIDLEALMEGKKDGATGGATRGPDPTRRKLIAEWLHDYLKDRGATVLAGVFDAAGEAGHIKKTKDGRWSVGTLYNARDFLPELDEPRDGMCVKECKLPLNGDGRKVAHWYLALDDGQAPD